MGSRNERELSDALNGVADLNGAITVEGLTGLWNGTPGDPFTDRQDFDTENIWTEENGGAVVLENGLNVLETDGTQAASRAVLETAALGIYRSGTQVRVAGGFTGFEAPTGDQFYEWGYGRAAGESYVRFRETAGDLQVRFSNETSGEKVVSRATGDLEPGSRTVIEDGNGTPVARVYGIDPMDGTGPSGIDYRGTEGVLSGFRVGWYGPTTTVPFMVGTGDVAGEYREKVFPLCLIDPVSEPLFTRPNEPWVWIADNDGTAPGDGDGLRLETGGRQFSYGGDIDAVRKDIVHQSPQMSIPMDGSGSTTEIRESGGATREWYVLGVFKRMPGDETTAVSLGDLSVASNNNLYVHARVLPESNLSGTLDYGEPTDTHAESSYVEVDMWDDTPSRVTVETAQIDGRTRLTGKSWGGRVVAGSGTLNSFTVGSANEFQLQFVRQNPVVLLGSTVDGTSATVSGNVGLPGVQ